MPDDTIPEAVLQAARQATGLQAFVLDGIEDSHTGGGQTIRYILRPMAWAGRGPS